MGISPALAAGIGILVSGGLLHAQVCDPLEEADLLPAAGAAGDEFGRAVALDGDVLVVGAMRDDELGTQAGAAYVYRFDGSQWVQEDKLFPDEEEGFTWFGRSVAVDGDRVVVGTNRDDELGPGAGAAYVFRYAGGQWTQEAKLLASDGEGGDSFGVAVAIAENAVLVGAVDDDVNGVEQVGSAYVFRFDGLGWSEEDKLVADDAAHLDQAGTAVAIDGDTALLASIGDDGSVSGSVYVFERDGLGWAQSAKLVASDGQEGDRFGWSLDIEGNRAVVSAYSDDDNGNWSGSAYVFSRQGARWTEDAKLLADDGESGDWFGHSIALSCPKVLVGANRDDVGALSDAGSAYVFRFDGVQWVQETKLVADAGQEGAWFGCAVALAGDTACVGALGFGFPSIPGEAYLYDLRCDPGEAALWTDLGQALAGTAGLPVLSGAGVLIGTCPVTFALTDAKPVSTAWFVIGLTAINAPFRGGVMVPSPDVALPLLVDSDGQIELSLPWPQGIPSGVPTYFQYWIVDTGAALGFAASNALESLTP